RVQARRMGIEASQNAGELRPTQPSKWSPSLKLPAISDRYARSAIATAAGERGRPELSQPDRGRPDRVAKMRARIINGQGVAGPTWAILLVVIEGDVGRGLACLAGCPRFCLMDLDRRGGEMGAEEQIAEALRPAVQAAGLEIWDV